MANGTNIFQMLLVFTAHVHSIHSIAAAIVNGQSARAVTIKNRLVRKKVSMQRRDGAERREGD